MRHTMPALRLFAILLIFSTKITPVLRAQVTEAPAVQRVIIELHNGRTMTGILIEETESDVRIETASMGIIKVAKIDIVSMQILAPGEAAPVFRANPQASRYYFAPSGIQLAAGEGYYQNAYLIYSQLSYGVTDHFTIGIPFVPFLGLGATAKIGGTLSGDLETGGVHGSVGGIAILDFTSNILDEPIGIGFGNLTFGREMSNFTIGLGRTFPDDPTTLLNAAFMTNLSDRTWLMSENYVLVLPNSNFNVSIFSLGIRRASRDKESLFDYAMVMISDGDFVFPLPWVSWTYSFGR